MASGEKESGLAKKILDAIKYIANDVILLIQQIRDYEEKQELAILIGVALAFSKLQCFNGYFFSKLKTRFLAVLLVKYLCKGSASKSVTESNANIRGYIGLTGGTHSLGNVDQVSVGDFARVENGRPVMEHIIENRDGANVNMGNVRQVSGRNLHNLQK